MSNRPHILLVNDDGIHAPGLYHLWKGLKDYVDITIVAPHTEKSGSGLAHTLTKPIHLRKVKWEDDTPAWSVGGTPADCVKLALHEVLKKNPDLIVSGINRGANAGRTVLHSGTVGCVIEGVIRNIPGIAFSCFDFHDTDYEQAEKHIYPVVKHFLEHPLPNGTLLNVNFPKNTHKPIKGFKMARQGKSHWIDNPDRRQHPEGSTYFWLGGRWNECAEHEESDVALLEKGYMTAVPIHINEMTDHAILEKHRSIFETLFSGISAKAD